VAPEKIENVVIQSLYIGQAFVYGDSFQNTLVAIVVPDEDPVRNMLASSEDPSLAKAPLSDICQSEKLNALLMIEIKRVAKEGGLLGFEVPKAIHLVSEPFSVENALLTPTFKLKRQQARDKYEKEIEAMYASILLSSSSSPASKL
jgi:long-chain acyl-CoA synthetase